MKKYIYRMSFIACILAFVSCDKDLEDINIDPNKPTEVLTGGIFNGANKNLLTDTRGGFPSGRMALPWVQYSAQRNYTEEDRYQFRSGVNNSLYRDIFLAAKAYKDIADFVSNPDNAAKAATLGHVENQLAAARIMLVYSQLQNLEIYGDIPYYSFGSDDPDFQGMTLGTANEITTPKFASQEKIYMDMLNELKEATASIETSAIIFNTGDHLFKSGEKLKRFGNSLMLKIANRVSKVLPEAKPYIDLAINGGVMQSNDDTVGQIFQNDRVNPAPWYTAAFIENRNDFMPTVTFVELLKGENTKAGVANPFFGQVDPRLFRMVAPKTQLVKDPADGQVKETKVRFTYHPALAHVPSIQMNNYVDRDASFYTGLPIGIPGSMTGSQVGAASQFSGDVYKADYTEILMEYAEVEFLLSEVKGWDQGHYIKGIEASMQRWKVAQPAIDAFVAAVAPANEETVMTQKYIALYMQPYEAWAEYRRTKLPRTLLLPGESHDLIAPGPNGETSYVFKPTPSVDYLTNLPERITYPLDLDLVNKDNKEAAAARMGGDKMDVKLIWAK
ncbi:SusD/RagB family nutrient-binding outer membrane lipoprotein [Myroides pelagicus]|uniref:SusD/RagB family nutrient-binding outer membrane lipoprotein n=1 Tax=Myroides pelagicus TaxID=270914 RepID=A0A7K1GJ41_9FLAO|nr:SusD/RagB family nutrient-binding outer membrane lipoprotein [Myroides pelagicus]MEC4113724.1 SusD/RagB family nutrient-binding outer membrane lipoprotein [Myroides pelagicus]MTH28818.1 SusD/RagB family nutrient-binding outer membrane lipoprotein [Myroides pelagicus]